MKKYVVRVQVTGYVDVEVEAEDRREAYRKAEQTADPDDACDGFETEAQEIIEEIDLRAFYRIQTDTDTLYVVLDAAPETEQEERELISFVLGIAERDILLVERIGAEDYEAYLHPVPIHGQVGWDEI